MTLSHWLIAHLQEIVGYLLAILLIPRILLERRHPGATVAWLLVIAVIPFLGVPLYFLIGGRTIERIRQIKGNPVDIRKPGTHSVIASLSTGHAGICRLLQKTGAYPPEAGNRVRIVADGVDAYGALMEMIDRAQVSIEIATFILGRDAVGAGVVGALSRKARQGVQVRLLLDALGCLRSRGKFVQPVREAGGRVGIFLPILPLRRRWSANLRNHRKMAIVDGSSAMLGGMNLADAYLGPQPKADRWKDVAILIDGAVAGDVRSIFWQDWVFSTREAMDALPPAPEVGAESQDGSIVQVVGGGPDMPLRPLYSGVLAALNQARQSIWVVTPYFVPDDPLAAALELSARMGCDVRLILPQHSNHPLVDLAGSSFLPDLLRAGVGIYHYTPGMLHAKMIAVDHQLAIIGSANMDIRSFQLNFEIATFLYDADDVAIVLDNMRLLMQKSRKLSAADMHAKGRGRRFAEDICRVFSPLL